VLVDAYGYRGIGLPTTVLALEGVGTSSWIFAVCEVFGMIVVKSTKYDVFPYPIEKLTFDRLFPMENLQA